jgi:hypothetical protein
MVRTGSASSGFQHYSLRVRVMENLRVAEPNFLDAMAVVSPSFSSYSSSDLDTESTGSFFYDKSITLGSLMGLKSDVRVSPRVVVNRQEIRSRESEVPRSRQNTRPKKPKSWWRLCRDSDDYDCHRNMNPSLEQFLEEERRTTGSNRGEGMYINIMYDEFTAGHDFTARNLLFSEGRILPPHSAHSRQQPSSVDMVQAESNHSWLTECFSRETVSRRSPVRESHDHGNQSVGSRLPTLFSGICCGRA